MSEKTFEYLLPSTLSFDNYLEVEKDIHLKIDRQSFEHIILNASNTKYISSAGLRVILGIRNKGYRVSVIDVSPEVYDVFDMTGFTKIIEVERAFRQVSIDGCRCIGKGVHGTVYSLAPDTIVKVYSNNTTLEEIKNERELSKRAFVYGLPTAIPLDIVKVGDQFGTIFELLNAISCASYISESQENTDDFINKATDLLKKIHSIEVNDGSLPDMKERVVAYVNDLKGHLSDDDFNKTLNIIKNVPQTNTLLHCDFHLKNQLVVKGELMLIDMDTLCIGHPYFELASTCNSYYQYGIIDSTLITDFLGISVEKANYIWWGIAKKYFSDLNEEEYQLAINKIRLIGLVRAFHFFTKHNYDKAIINKALNELITVLANL